MKSTSVTKKDDKLNRECNKCFKTKSLNDYYLQNKAMNYYGYSCKDCIKKSNKYVAAVKEEKLKTVRRREYEKTKWVSSIKEIYKLEQLHLELNLFRVEMIDKIEIKENEEQRRALKQELNKLKGYIYRCEQYFFDKL